MPRVNFAAQIDQFKNHAEEKIELIVKRSAQRIFSEAQKPVHEGGRMPVDTGFLRNSAQSGLNGATTGKGAESYKLSVAGLELGDTIYIVWTAEYAKYIEYGTSKISPRFFMRGAAQEWQRIVNEEAKKVLND